MPSVQTIAFSIVFAAFATYAIMAFAKDLKLAEACREELDKLENEDKEGESG